MKLINILLLVISFLILSCEDEIINNGNQSSELSNKIDQLCQSPFEKQLWQDRFLRMRGQSMAGYAEQRTYYYNNKAIDQQVHLGMDIASTASAAIKAANRGKVIFADYIGIYGNTVILDHGQGIFSLYSHLSRIDTALEEIVDQGALIFVSVPFFREGSGRNFSIKDYGHNKSYG